MIEPWFIPIDISMIISAIFGMILSIIFLYIIIIDKACHTIPMILVANTCLVAFLLGCDGLSVCIFMLINDIKQIEYEDSLCVFRAYLGYAVVAALNFSFLLQSIYKYVMVVYPTRLFLRSAKFQILSIISIWIFSFIHPFVYTLNNEIKYNVHNQICQIPLRASFSMIYMALCCYTIPVPLIAFIYIKLIRHVRQMKKRVISVTVYSRANKELQMVRRIVILVMILVVVSFPYEVFVIMGMFTNPPKYHFRYACICVCLSYTVVMICLFQFTDPVKSYVMRKIKQRTNVVAVVMNDIKK